MPSDEQSVAPLRHRLLHEIRNGSGLVVFPRDDYFPTCFSEAALCVDVAGAVRPQLFPPPFTIPDGVCTVLGAVVPPTRSTVDRYPRTGKDDVDRSPRRAWDDPLLEAETQTAAM